MEGEVTKERVWRQNYWESIHKTYGFSLMGKVCPTEFVCPSWDFSTHVFGALSHFFRHFCEVLRQDPAILEVLVSIVFASMVLQPVQVAVGFTRSSAENSLIHDGVLQCPSLLHQLVHHFLFFRMFMVLLFHKGTGMDFHNNHRESLQQIGILLLRQIESLKHGQETGSV